MKTNPLTSDFVQRWGIGLSSSWQQIFFWPLQEVFEWINCHLMLLQFLPRSARRRRPRWYPPAGGSSGQGPSAGAVPQNHSESSSGSWWTPTPSGGWHTQRDDWVWSSHTIIYYNKALHFRTACITTKIPNIGEKNHHRKWKVKAVNILSIAGLFQIQHISSIVLFIEYPCLDLSWMLDVTADNMKVCWQTNLCDEIRKPEAHVKLRHNKRKHTCRPRCFSVSHSC